MAARQEMIGQADRCSTLWGTCHPLNQHLVIDLLTQVCQYLHKERGGMGIPHLLHTLCNLSGVDTRHRFGEIIPCVGYTCL